MMIKPWEVLSSKIELEDRWIKVRADDCQRSDGLIIKPYYVLEYADWVCVLAITPDGNVVLTTEYRHGVRSIVTGLPSGVVDKEDSGPEGTARRELLEETGYTSEHMVPLGSLYANCTNQPNLVHYFLARDAELTGTPALDANEQIDVELVPWEQVRSTPFLRQSHHVACLHLAEKYFDVCSPATIV
ncbi:8-oxo-dGTP pyrophosphatase MutT (NUDIX family) [Phyllobacterium endophyticum]|nr:8-oxo-dGTP pyrophosphatase MutT (NUDIX family) [Phyllobacterium endophyticum]